MRNRLRKKKLVRRELGPVGRNRCVGRDPLLPTPAGLPVAGHRMLAILAFAVIVWMTEAIDYAVSAIVIAALMAFLLGFSPTIANPKVLMGTSAGAYASPLAASPTPPWCWWPPRCSWPPP